MLLDTDIDEILARLGATARGFSGARVLLAGGGGFLGRYFIEIFHRLNAQVLDKPCRVTVLDNFKVGSKVSVTAPGADITIHSADITSDRLPDDSFDWVIHAAGIASPYYYRAYPLETLEVATVGTKRLLELANTCRARFLYFSSSEIYGDPDPAHVPTLESYRGNVATLGPRACYDEGKRVGETYCHIFHGYHGVHTNIVRPFNVFGPGMQQEDYRVMPNFASQIVNGAPLRVYGSGGQTRTFCYIVDAMVGFLLAALRGVPGEAYNIGNPRPEISMGDLAARFKAVSPLPVTYQLTEYPDSYPADEPMRRCPNIEKAERQLDFVPAVDLDEGLKRFLTWAVDAYRRDG